MSQAEISLKKDKYRENRIYNKAKGKYQLKKYQIRRKKRIWRKIRIKRSYKNQ